MKLKQLERQQSGYRSEVQSLMLELQALRSAPIADSKPGSVNSLATGGDATAPGSKGSQKSGFGDMLAKMMADPAMKKMMRQQQAAAMDMMYGPLFKEINLSPDDKEKFKELLLDRQMKAVETGGAFMKLQGEDTDKTAAMNDLAGGVRSRAKRKSRFAWCARRLTARLISNAVIGETPVSEVSDTVVRVLSNRGRQSMGTGPGS